MNTEGPLLGVRLKIERAKKHYADLGAAIDAFKAREPWSVVMEIDGRSGSEVYRFRQREPIPPIWGAIIGDCVHNLRSAFDLLANAMVIVNGGTPNNYTAFPISPNVAHFESSGISRISGASAKAIEVVRGIKPYNGGNDTLFRLHSLDIADKHRILFPVAAANQKFGVRSDIRSPGTEHYPPAVTLTGRPINTKFPLKDGDELIAYRRAPSGLDDKTEFKFEFDVAFSDELVGGHPVIKTLHELVVCTEEIVDLIALAVWGQD